MQLNSRIIGSLTLVFCLVLPAAAQFSGPPVVLSHVNIVAPDGTIQQDMSLRLRAGKIWEIGKDLNPLRGESVIDEAGAYVIPGLIDTRVQLAVSPANQIYRAEVGEEQRTAWLHTMVRLGITTARIFQGDLNEQRFFKGFRQDDLLNSPQLLISGPTFTAPNGSPTDQYAQLASGKRRREVMEVTTADEAREKSRVVAHNSGDVFEIVFSKGASTNPQPRLSEEALKVITQEAHGHELKAFCWVGTNEEAQQAVADGCDVLQGMTEELFAPDTLRAMKEKSIPFVPSLLYQGYLVDHKLRPEDYTRYIAEPLVADNITPLIKQSLEAERGVATAMRKVLQVRAGAGSDEVNEALAPRKPEANQKPEADESKPKAPTVADMFQLQEGRAFQNASLAKNAGIRVVVGTGAGSLLNFPGIAVHMEMQLLAEHGFTPFEALQAATSNAAFSLGLDKDLGSVEKGKQANLVLLSDNPLTNMLNTSKVKSVIWNGRVIDPSHIDQY